LERMLKVLNILFCAAVVGIALVSDSGEASENGVSKGEYVPTSIYRYSNQQPSAHLSNRLRHHNYPHTYTTYGYRRYNSDGRAVDNRRRNPLLFSGERNNVTSTNAMGEALIPSPNKHPNRCPQKQVWDKHLQTCLKVSKLKLGGHIG